MLAPGRTARKSLDPISLRFRRISLEPPDPARYTDREGALILMKTAHLVILGLACTLAARADFSYSQTRKSATGMMAGAAGGQNQVTKTYFKGQKMKIDSGATAHIFDFEAQTVTNINNTDKSYTVTKFSDLGQALQGSGASVSVDVKETGQRKQVNGFNASQVIMTMSMDGMGGPAAGMKMQVEMEMWISPDVPGAKEARAFFDKNGERFPWSALAGGGNPAMQKSMAEVQRKMSALHGMPVMQVMRVKTGGGGEMSQAQQQMQQAQSDPRMAQAMAQLEAMKKQGGAQAAAAEQAMARMGAMRGMAGAGGGGALMEVTTESGDFSTSSISDQVFAVPSGYQKK
jgi:hypothetical protein